MQISDKAEQKLSFRIDYIQTAEKLVIEKTLIQL